MGIHKHVFKLLIIVVSLTSLKANDHHDEYGYDFGAYPSYIIPTDDDVKFNDSIIDLEFPEVDSVSTKTEVTSKSINVLDFGAQGDGKIDDTKAFKDAWKKACSSSKAIIVVIPKGKTYLVKPLKLFGPCKSRITLEVDGVVKASDDRSDYDADKRHWIIFEDVQNLVVQGEGTIDGNGNIWWQNSCKIDKTKRCVDAPTALTFYKCSNLLVKNLKIENAQQIHVSIEQCNNVEVANLVVKAPEDSPNTDGIHITATKNIHVHSSVIGTGDDCISIVSGSQKVRTTDITCGPGHGISIGSLGSKNSREYVTDVVVNRAKLSGTTNGVRIKTWQGGSGEASNIVFQNIEMQNVKNPIIIDQNYCDQNTPCKDQKSAVQVKNIMYQNITGSSTSNPTISFECSKSHPCRGIVLQNVDLEREDGARSKAVCNNVNLQMSGNVYPSCP